MRLKLGLAAVGAVGLLVIANGLVYGQGTGSSAGSAGQAGVLGPCPAPTTSPGATATPLVTTGPFIPITPTPIVTVTPLLPGAGAGGMPGMPGMPGVRVTVSPTASASPGATPLVAVSPGATPSTSASPGSVPMCITVSIPQGAVGKGTAAFGTNPLVVPLNTTVTWRNDDSVAHTVTANDGSFDSGTLQPGQSFSHTFTSAGTFSYYCAIHGQASMSGSVQVGGGGAGNAGSAGGTSSSGSGGGGGY
jgi:plastocyanin